MSDDSRDADAKADRKFRHVEDGVFLFASLFEMDRLFFTIDRQGILLEERLGVERVWQVFRAKEENFERDVPSFLIDAFERDVDAKGRIFRKSFRRGFRADDGDVSRGVVS